MATLDPRNNMVYWKIYINNSDITSRINQYVSGIDIKYTVLPVDGHTQKRKSPKKNASPNTASIKVTSLHYIEDLFLPGRSIKIYLGYDKLNLPLVFSGSIYRLPDGRAQELLDYVVEAHGEEAKLNMKQTKRVFQKQFKESIVMTIAQENNWDLEMKIPDSGSTAKPRYMYIQHQMTDLQFLEKCAADWGCKVWFTYPNKMHFYDAKDAHLIGEPYYLGYRTGSCNVQSVSWSHETPRNATEVNPGMFGFSEDGMVIGKHEFEYVDRNDRSCVWGLNEAEEKLAKEGKATPLSWAYDVTEMTARQGIFDGLETHFHIVRYNDNTKTDVPPANADSGWKIKIKLNKGDPYLWPPRNGKLFSGSGSLNPRADSARLPEFLKYYARKDFDPNCILLKINEHHLSYGSGILNSELYCTRGLFV